MKFSREKKCVGDVTPQNFERLTTWHWTEAVYRRFGGITSWIEQYSEKELNKILNDFTKARKKIQLLKGVDISVSQNKIDIENFIIRFVKQNPNTNFYFILPANFRLYFRTLEEHDFSKWVAIIKWLVAELEKYPNAKIYGFDTLDYSDNIANYHDIIHYDKDMNSMQLDAIANGTNILTSKNIDEYFKIMQEKINAYDIEPLINILEQALKFK